MAAAKKPIFVKITGTGIVQSFQCMSHDMQGLPAGTYHVFEMADGVKMYLNDFGIRTVLIADDPAKLI
jgi:hypothetical protein